MNRRGFLGSILAACAAPAIVRADSLMRIVPTDTLVVVELGDTFMTVAKADAPWIGAVRELSQYDVRWDDLIRRWDVMVRYPGGEIAQLGVDMRGGPLGANREIALRVLKSRCAEDGFVPIRGALEVPQGVHEAKFI